MNKSKSFLERYNQYQEDKAELEEIRKFEEEIQKEYGPIIARTDEEFDAVFAKAKERRRQNAHK